MVNVSCQWSNMVQRISAQRKSIYDTFLTSLWHIYNLGGTHLGRGSLYALLFLQSHWDLQMGQQKLIVWFTWNIMTTIWDVITKFTIYIHKTLHNITDTEQNKTESGIFRGIRYDMHNTHSHRNNLLKTFVPQFRQIYVKSHWHTHEVNPAQCIPDSKVHGANMGPTWVPSAPDGPHIGPMNLSIRVVPTELPWVHWMVWALHHTWRDPETVFVRL